jgi:pyroglutamyl-peptidase
MISTLRERLEKKPSKAARNGRKQTIKFIVTGFNSFGKNLENPSGLAAISLPSQLDIGQQTVEIHSFVLETCCTAAWTKVKRLLRSSADQKTVLILMGLAARRDVLNLERLALNVRDYPIKDNHGHRYDGERILPGPLALETQFPLHALRKKLSAKGFPCEISNHAGTYVCNDIYYQSLSFQARNGSPDLCLFIHVPRANKFAAAVREKGSKRLHGFVSKRLSKAKQIELLALSVLETIKFCTAFLEDEP